MSGTHHQLLYHFVFSSKNRKPDLQPETQATMFKYIGGTTKGLDVIPIRVGGWVDHVQWPNEKQLAANECGELFAKSSRGDTI